MKISSTRFDLSEHQLGDAHDDRDELMLTHSWKRVRLLDKLYRAS